VALQGGARGTSTGDGDGQSGMQGQMLAPG
jgi:hypothetical protein